MATKNNEFKGLIYSNFGTMCEFADALGWNRGKLSHFVTGKSKPSLDDIKEMSLLLCIPPIELVKIFLA